MYFSCTNNCVQELQQKWIGSDIVYSIKQMLEGPEHYQRFSSDLQIMTGS